MLEMFTCRGPQNSRQLATVTTLLHCGANINVRNNKGQTATDLACASGKGGAICDLLTDAAGASAPPASGKRIAGLAKRAGRQFSRHAFSSSDEL